MHPTPRAKRRKRASPSLRAHAREEERDREEHDPEDVVRRALDVPADGRGRHLGFGVQLGSFLLAASLYCGMTNGVSGAFGFFSGFVATHALNAGLNSSRNLLK